MSFKKFAMLILAATVLFGVSGKTAAAEDNAITNIEQITVNGEDVVTSVEDTQTDSNGETVVTPSDEETVVTPSEETITSTQDPEINKEEEKKNSTTEKKPAASKKKTAKKAYTKSELRLMASIINCEAGGESYQGQLAVGIVIMNRIKSNLFPNSLKKVIYQKYQFSPVRNGMLNKKLAEYDKGKTNTAQWKSCIKAAKKTLSGQTSITYKGKNKSLKGYHFFSVTLSGTRFRLGGHCFK